MKACHLLLFALTLLGVMGAAQGETHFIEAESFTVQDNGWRVIDSQLARKASAVGALQGAAGKTRSIATHAVTIQEAGPWKLWVRYMVHTAERGPFDVAVLADGKTIATATFDLERAPNVKQWDYTWAAMELNLTPGQHTIQLAKHRNRNASGYTRVVDCFHLTNDLQAKPDHVPFGPQTWMRVTLREGHGKPVYIHVFADHYRSPWYAHYAISRDTLDDGLRPKRREGFLSDGQSTGWVNISPMIYQDSGAHLLITPAYTYHDRSKRFNAIIELASQASDDKIARRFEIDQQPATLHMVVPPNLLTPENIARLRIDREFSFDIGEKADHFIWPAIGRKPDAFPFLVVAGLDPSTMAGDVIAREVKTANHFGFNGGIDHPDFAPGQRRHRSLGGIGWFFTNTFSNPEIDKLRSRAQLLYKQDIQKGITPQDVAFVMLMDEPTGQPASVLASDEPSIEAFRAWLKGKGLTPADLRVASWEEVKPIVETQRDKQPALHYYTQQFRTVALGQFLTLLRTLMEENWKTSFPTNVNFSDGAVYYANFYGQGVDYFTLLRETDQNALWSEDWSNRASTYHCATYNVELMRAAARQGRQHLGQHLIAYAGRKSQDIRLKAVSEAARGVKAFKTYAYGPAWSGHDRSAWQQHTHLWFDHATAIREIGAVEDMLLPAMPRPAQVALLYASSSDIWALGVNNAPGFERMHTWLALAHQQIPVDIVHEKQVEAGLLEGYRVAYLNTPNLTRASADTLRQWVLAGGTLVLTAGAGQFDEFNQPMDALDSLLPFKRDAMNVFQRHTGAGIDLASLRSQGSAMAGQAKVNLLSARQAFSQVMPSANVTVTGQFEDGSPAAVTVSAGKGKVIVQGFMPALDYIQRALLARKAAGVKDSEPDAPATHDNTIPGEEAILKEDLTRKSYNPWEYPDDIRQLITAPVAQAGLDLPIRCDVPLVDAIYMTCDAGVLIPLANYTLKPIAKMTLELAVDKPVKEVRSVHQGVLDAVEAGKGKIRVTLPLDCTDFITIRY